MFDALRASARNCSANFCRCAGVNAVGLLIDDQYTHLVAVKAEAAFLIAGYNNLAVGYIKANNFKAAKETMLKSVEILQKFADLDSARKQVPFITSKYQQLVTCLVDSSQKQLLAAVATDILSLLDFLVENKFSLSEVPFVANQLQQLLHPLAYLEDPMLGQRLEGLSGSVMEPYVGPPIQSLAENTTSGVTPSDSGASTKDLKGDHPKPVASAGTSTSGGQRRPGGKKKSVEKNMTIGARMNLLSAAIEADKPSEVQLQLSILEPKIRKAETDKRPYAVGMRAAVNKARTYLAGLHKPRAAEQRRRPERAAQAGGAQSGARESAEMDASL